MSTLQDGKKIIKIDDDGEYIYQSRKFTLGGIITIPLNAEGIEKKVITTIKNGTAKMEIVVTWLEPLRLG